MDVNAIIAALEAEAAGYARRGLTHRLEAVNAQLVALGREGILSTRQPSTASPQGDSKPKPARRKATK